MVRFDESWGLKVYYIAADCNAPHSGRGLRPISTSLGNCICAVQENHVVPHGTVRDIVSLYTL